MQENRDVKLPLDVRKEIYKGMASYFTRKLTPKNHEEWKEILRDFYVIDDDSSERNNTHEVEFEYIITDSSVSDAFFSGRYGHLENYIPNLDALYHLAYSIRNSIKMQYPNAISITDDIFGCYNSSGVRFIFPDENSKIYVFDGKNKLTRVYTLENAHAFILKRYGMSLNDSKHEDHKKLSICPECGIENMREIPEYALNKDGLADVSLRPTSLLKVKKDTESIIICEIDGQQKGYIYKNGRIIETNEERVQEYSQLIDEYETDRENGKYEEETQKIKENFLDRKSHEKYNIEYEKYLENRLGTRKHEKIMIRLGRYTSGALNGAKVFKGNLVGKKLLKKADKFIETMEEEDDIYQNFFDEEIEKIKKENEQAYSTAIENIENTKNNLLIYAREKIAEKRGSHEELEDKLDDEELIEAYGDKHGIGKELLSKIKELFIDKGEK